MVRCYVYLFGEELFICLEDGALLTSSNKEDATLFEKPEDCNYFLRGTELREIDGYEEVVA